MANDVVQYARRKKVNDLYAILKGAISDVVPLLREDSIIQNVQRVLTVSRGWPLLGWRKEIKQYTPLMIFDARGVHVLGGGGMVRKDVWASM